MNYEEALAWLRGERSMANYFRGSMKDEQEVWLAQADAALTEQAYWVVKAHHEGLLSAEEEQA